MFEESQQQDTDGTTDDTIESEARNLGWAPREEWRGDPDQWRDAGEFLDHGRKIMPILKKNNERLEKQLLEQQAETRRLNGIVQAAQESMEELRKFHSEATKAAVERARKELSEEIRQAREDGDVDLEMQLTDQLAEVRATQREAERAQRSAPEVHQPAQQEVPADFQRWLSRNPWFGQDQRRTMRAEGLARSLRADPANDALVGDAFWELLDQELSGGSSARTPAKVAGASGGGASGGHSASGGRYADLDADAKQVCDSRARKMVGEGRAFKTLPEWQDYFAKMVLEN